jgi:quercetin dioxygenase-like cupin family protein
MGATLKITPTESIEILSSDQEALLLEATYLPGEPPPKHLHPEQDEHFEVLEGESAWTSRARSAPTRQASDRSRTSR